MKSDEIACPRCAETIKKAAVVCRFCGTDFSKAELGASGKKKKAGPLSTFLAFLVVVAFVGWRSSQGSKTDPAVSAEKVKKAEEKKAEDRRRGFHCLSAWDGSDRQIVEALKRSLRDPDSFQHIETRITPVDAKGQHFLTMEYRARNGFGGMNVGHLVARVNNSDCSFKIISSQ